MAEQAGKLEGKIAVVTGAGRGIGRAIALTYAREGSAVCCAARTMEDVESTVEEIERLGGSGLAVRTDVTDLESVRRMSRPPSPWVAWTSW
jgi:NAD(P)-dependent dehydrogenase (short-subunit alcohol dehydrogenase family)